MTAKGEESYFIYDLEKSNDGDSENCYNREKECSTDSMNLGLGDARHDISSPIKSENGTKRSEFFRFLDIADRLTDDIRRLHDALAIEKDKSEKLLIENCELKIENNKLKSSVIAPPLCGQDNTVNNKNIVFESITIESDTVSQKKKRPNKRQRKNNKAHVGNTDNKQEKNNEGNPTKVLPSRKENEQEVAKAQVASAYKDFFSQKGKASGNTREGRPSTSSKNKRSAVILGDSIVKNVCGWELKEKCGQNNNVYVKCFNGANIKDMHSYAKPSIERKPNVIILHIGTNDLAPRRNEAEKSEVQIAHEIIDLANEMRLNDTEVVISGLVPRGDEYEMKRKRVNLILADLCSENNYAFIEHTNIDASKHLNKSLIHLNRAGDNLFETNLVRALRY